MNTTLLVHTQYLENYNVGPEGFGEVPHWKPKGGHTFSMQIDSDILLYCDDTVAILTKMVEQHNSIAEKFEYIDHEIQWQEPTNLGSQEQFLDLMKQIESVNV
jgi:hypothetical protein